MVVEASKRPKMTAVDNITSLRQRREAIVRQHAEAENRHDVEATIATFHHPRYEFNGHPSDGGEAVRELLQGFMHGFPDFHIEPTRLRHLDDGVLVEGLMTGTHDGEWASMRPTGRRIEVPVVGIFEFDADRLLCEKVHLDMAKVLKQIGVLPAVS
jgi:predicted ester cyclase